MLKTILIRISYTSKAGFLKMPYDWLVDVVIANRQLRLKNFI